MNFFNSASGQSVWRGYYYYLDGNVLSYEKVDDHTYKGIVSGSDDNKYNVTIDISKPKRSVCDCPHAEGSRIVCKHKCALYFAVFPEKADEFIKMVEEQQEEADAEREQLESEVHHYVYHMTKSELQYALLDILFSSGDYVFNRFVEEYIDLETE